MKLSEVPYDNVHLGMRVISAKGTLGTVIEKMSLNTRDYGSDGVLILWDNGNKSCFTILELFNVEVEE